MTVVCMTVQGVLFKISRSLLPAAVRRAMINLLITASSSKSSVEGIRQVSLAAVMKSGFHSRRGYYSTADNYTLFVTEGT